MLGGKDLREGRSGLRFRVRILRLYGPLEKKTFSTTIKLEQAGAGTCTSCPNVQAAQVLGSRVVRLSSGFPRKSKRPRSSGSLRV